MDEIHKENIIKFLRLIVLQEKQLECCLLFLIPLEILKSREADIGKIIDSAKKQIESDAFFKKHVGPFEELFSEEEVEVLIRFYEEIKVLLNFYKLETVKKFLKNWRKLFHPMSQSYQQIVKEVLEKNQ